MTKKTIMRMIKLCEQEISSGCNSSFITLIPKVDDPLCLKDYRPISLIGVYTKILSKLLANRLKLVIRELVGEEQNAFIQGRHILDGILVVNESIQHLKKLNEKYAIFKLDIEKAYDSLNWNFLLKIMQQMGFKNKWLLWISSLLKSTTISILINGSPTPRIFNCERS